MAQKSSPSTSLRSVVAVEMQSGRKALLLFLSDCHLACILFLREGQYGFRKLSGFPECAQLLLSIFMAPLPMLICSQNSLQPAQLAPAASLTFIALKQERAHRGSGHLAAMRRYGHQLTRFLPPAAGRAQNCEKGDRQVTRRTVSPCRPQPEQQFSSVDENQLRTNLICAMLPLKAWLTLERQYFHSWPGGLDQLPGNGRPAQSRSFRARRPPVLKMSK